MIAQQEIDAAYQELLGLRAYVEALQAVSAGQQGEPDEPGEVVVALIEPIRCRVMKAIIHLEPGS